jgi:hypothetical protein
MVSNRWHGVGCSVHSRVHASDDSHQTHAPGHTSWSNAQLGGWKLPGQPQESCGLSASFLYCPSNISFTDDLHT